MEMLITRFLPMIMWQAFASSTHEQTWQNYQKHPYLSGLFVEWI